MKKEQRIKGCIREIVNLENLADACRTEANAYWEAQKLVDLGLSDDILSGKKTIDEVLRNTTPPHCRKKKRELTRCLDALSHLNVFELEKLSNEIDAELDDRHDSTEIN